MEDGDIEITPADNLPPVQDPPTPEELKEMSEGRKDVLADQRERVAFIASQNCAALQVLLSAELGKYVDPKTGEPCATGINATGADKLHRVAVASGACAELMKP